MVRAGYREAWRIHGLELPQPKVHLYLANPAFQGAGPSHAQVEFFIDPPNFPAGRVPKVAVAGVPVTFSSVSPAEPRDPSFVGSWLMITVIGEYGLQPGLEAAFAAEPAKHATEVLSLVEPLIRPDGALWCAAAVGSLAVQFDQIRFESLASYVGLIAPGGSGDQWSQGFGVHVVLRLAKDADALEAPLAIGARVLGATHSIPERLGLSLHWFLRAREERAGSIDRFLWLYLSLEAAVKAATDDRPTDAWKNQFEALRKIVREQGPALAPFVQQIESRLRQPFVSDRFRTLATRHFGHQVDEDCQEFARFGRLRGQLVHPGAQVADRAALGADADLLDAFTIRYLSAIMAGLPSTATTPLIRQVPVLGNRTQWPSAGPVGPATAPRGGTPPKQFGMHRKPGK